MKRKQAKFLALCVGLLYVATKQGPSLLKFYGYSPRYARRTLKRLENGTL